MTEPYIYEISPHFIHEIKRKGYDVMYAPAEYEQSNLKVAYRFCDENDNEGEVFSILLVVPAREPASFWRENVIAICHSTTGFSRRRQ